jgi:sterol desaturase/sphingolipid hydroxylase (fatty acid hydroxylase superfamily)
MESLRLWLLGSREDAAKAFSTVISFLEKQDIEDYKPIAAKERADTIKRWLKVWSVLLVIGIIGAVIGYLPFGRVGAVVGFVVAIGIVVIPILLFMFWWFSPQKPNSA